MASPWGVAACLWRRCARSGRHAPLHVPPLPGPLPALFRPARRSVRAVGLQGSSALSAGDPARPCSQRCQGRDEPQHVLLETPLCEDVKTFLTWCTRPPRLRVTGSRQRWALCCRACPGAHGGAEGSPTGPLRAAEGGPRGRRHGGAPWKRRDGWGRGPVLGVMEAVLVVRSARQVHREKGKRQRS